MTRIAVIVVAAIALLAGSADAKGGLSRAESRYVHKRLAAERSNARADAAPVATAT